MSTFDPRIGAVVAAGILAAAPLSMTKAQAPADASTKRVELTEFVATVAKQIDRTFVLDPRVRGEAIVVEAQHSPSTYADLLTVLQVNGFAAVDDGRVVRIVPDAVIRQLPIPIVQSTKGVPDAAYVTKVIAVRHVPAAQLVPLLRPLLPQQAHLAAEACNNNLLIVDTAANVERIEALVKQLDQGDSYKPTACPSGSAPPRD